MGLWCLCACVCLCWVVVVVVAVTRLWHHQVGCLYVPACSHAHISTSCLRIMFSCAWESGIWPESECAGGYAVCCSGGCCDSRALPLWEGLSCTNSVRHQTWLGCTFSLPVFDGPRRQPAGLLCCGLLLQLSCVRVGLCTSLVCTLHFTPWDRPDWQWLSRERLLLAWCFGSSSDSGGQQ